MTVFSAIRRTLVSGAVLASSLAAFGLSSLPAQAAEGDLLEKIKAAGEIRIGTEGTYPPYTY